jgi:hypothetical protein
MTNPPVFIWAKKNRSFGPDQVSMAVPVDMSSGFGVLEHESIAKSQIPSTKSQGVRCQK